MVGQMECNLQTIGARDMGRLCRYKGLIGWRIDWQHDTQKTLRDHTSIQLRKAVCHWNGPISQNEASLEVDLSTHSAEWHCLDLRSGRSVEEAFDLDDDEDWERLASMIRQLGLKDE